MIGKSSDKVTQDLGHVIGTIGRYVDLKAFSRPAERSAWRQLENQFYTEGRIPVT